MPIIHEISAFPVYRIHCETFVPHFANRWDPFTIFPGSKSVTIGLDHPCLQIFDDSLDSTSSVSNLENLERRDCINNWDCRMDLCYVPLPPCSASWSANRSRKEWTDTAEISGRFRTD